MGGRIIYQCVVSFADIGASIMDPYVSYNIYHSDFTECQVSVYCNAPTLISTLTLLSLLVGRPHHSLYDGTFIAPDLGIRRVDLGTSASYQPVDRQC